MFFHELFEFVASCICYCEHCFLLPYFFSLKKLIHHGTGLSLHQSERSRRSCLTSGKSTAGWSTAAPATAHCRDRCQRNCPGGLLAACWTRNVIQWLTLYFFNGFAAMFAAVLKNWQVFHLPEATLYIRIFISYLFCRWQDSKLLKKLFCREGLLHYAKRNNVLF